MDSMTRMFGYLPFNITGVFIIAIFLWAIYTFIFGALLMWLWNITIPNIFGIRQISFWEAFRLIIIAAILFGGIRFLPFS